MPCWPLSQLGSCTRCRGGATRTRGRAADSRAASGKARRNSQRRPHQLAKLRWRRRRDGPAEQRRGPVSIYTVSKAVYAFLHTGLGLALGGSAKLSGTKSGNTITLTAGKPTTVGLPSGVAAPAFGATKIVIDTKTNVLTATSSARAPAPATLSVQIAHANTSTLAGSGSRPRRCRSRRPVLGKPVTLAGPLTNSGARPVVALAGTLPAADVVKSGVLAVATGAVVTLSTTGGVQVKGAATVGAGASAAEVTINGTVTNASSWRLRVTRSATNNSWKPIPGVTATPNSPATSLTQRDGSPST